MGLAWLLVGAIMYISVWGKHYGQACIHLSKFNFFPINNEIMSVNEFKKIEIFEPDCFELSCSRFWFLIAGWWLALCHVIFAVINFITVVGISSGQRHLQLACASLSPVGKIVVTSDAAVKVKKNNAVQKMQKLKYDLSDKRNM